MPQGRLVRTAECVGTESNRQSPKAGGLQPLGLANAQPTQVPLSCQYSADNPQKCDTVSEQRPTDRHESGVSVRLLPECGHFEFFAAAG